MFVEINETISLKIKYIKRYPIHTHENITEILLPIKGDLNVVIMHEHVHVKEGDFCFINNKALHSMQSVEGSTVAIFHINLNLYQKKYPYIKNMFFRNNMYSTKNLEVNCDNFDYEKKEYKIMFRNKLIGILLSSLYKTKLSHEISSIYEKQLMESMIHDFNWIQFLNSEHIPHDQLTRYHRVVKYIHDHIFEKITLEDIAAREYLSKNYFCHFWKDISYFSFLDRVCYEKIIYSEHMLLLTDHSIVSIAEKFGFSDVKYYYRHFKKWYGLTPQHYRDGCNKYMDLEMIYVDIPNEEAQKIFNEYLVFYSLPSFGNFNLPTVDDDPLINKLFSLDERNFTKNSMSVVMDLYKYIEITNKVLEINFHTIYQIILLTNVKNLGLTIKIDCSSIEESYFFNALNTFFEFSLFHFGKKIIREWDYFIRYTENVSASNIREIKDIVQNNVEEPIFRYYLEI